MYTLISMSVLHVIQALAPNKNSLHIVIPHDEGNGGAPGGIRTPNQRSRNPLLYPVELRAQKF